MERETMQNVNITLPKIDFQFLKALAKKLKWDIHEETPLYDPEFTKELDESLQQAKEGKVKSINVDELWK
ncbi:MAG: hypothetical protein PHR53_02545 [Bacteroidales bacterium]|nr:hypothetical protein [Bacteroidales bacterium]